MQRLGAAAIVLLMLTQLFPGTSAAQVVAVTGKRGDVRLGPGAAYDIMGEVREGERYPTLQKHGEWYQIRLVDGREGWVHERLVSEEASRGSGRSSPAHARGVYSGSWAVLIGINEYRIWPKLNYAVNDAKSLRGMLIKLGFDPGKIIELYDQAATKENILRVVADELPRKTGPNDRVFFFFAGHGQTEELPGGIKRGYLIPIDGDLDNLYAKSIPMNVVADISLRIPAKHILFVMDACYSGLALARASTTSPLTPGYLEKITAAKARQIITAGGAGEQVFELDGHGLFTRRLLEALGGAADDNRDDILTAFELGTYLRHTVSAESRNKQTPVFGIIEGEGEFVFLVPEDAGRSTVAGKSTESVLSTQRTQEEPKTAPQELKPEVARLDAKPVQYHLQVTHLDFGTFSTYLDKATSGRSGEESMERLEGRLDRMEFPTAAVIPGRELQLLTEPGYGGKPPTRLATVPTPKEQSWTTLVWEGNPGETIAFVVKSEMRAWQTVRALAGNAGGTLRHLSIGGRGLFGRQGRQVPDVAFDYIDHAARRGTFTSWLEGNAKAIHGMSTVVGRSSERSTPDRVYTVIQLPPEPRTFKLVIGWEQPEQLRDFRFPR